MTSTNYIGRCHGIQNFKGISQTITFVLTERTELDANP